MVKVSIIMPVYNSEEYLAYTVESILNQGFDDFELILIDDGSDDQSGEYCDAFAEIDPRVRVVHKENGGMCEARNLGISIATGKYVAFCDNDDECLKGFLAENYEIAEQCDADCVRFGRRMRIVGTSGKLVRETAVVPREQRVVSFTEAASNPLGTVYYGTDGVWAGFYRREIIIENGIHFDERLRHGFEDVLFNDAFLFHSKRIALNPRIHYNWYRRESHSVSMTVDENQLLGMQLALEQEEKMFPENADEPHGFDFFAYRFTEFAKDLIVSNHLKEGCNLQQESLLYKKLADLGEPYRGRLLSHKINPKFQVIKHLIMQRNYIALYNLVTAGLALKAL